MPKVNVTIDGVNFQTSANNSIVDSAKEIGINIPTLCHHTDLCVAGNCRVCVVEAVGQKRLIPACCTPVWDGMKIKTNTEIVRKTRKNLVELLLSEHNSNCITCVKNNKCELQKLATILQINNIEFIPLLHGKATKPTVQSCSIIYDQSKCIRCLRCVRTCEEIQHIGALTPSFKGSKMKITTFNELPLCDVVCSNCGQCINHCPTGALTETTAVNQVWNALSHPDSHTVVQTAPAVRIGIGEAFNHQPGDRLTGKVTSALKRLGFDSVLDTNFTADLTIIEEGYELLNRLKTYFKDGNKDTKLPLITSCSPGWIKFAEHRFPELLSHLSTCKSPQQMFGTLSKTYYADKKKINPQKITSVSIMPCTAKKFEANRPEMNDSGFKDVDYVLTTRELANMITQAGIDFDKLENTHFDSIMGVSTGAGMIFGASGGVMEAALRTAYEIITGDEVPFPNLDIKPLRGLDGIKTAELKIERCKDEWKFLEGINLKLAIAHGLHNAFHLLTDMEKGVGSYHFIEIMACPGGCLGGGGQPYPINNSIRQQRMKAVYEEDSDLPLRKSHENPEIIKLYEDFLHEPNSEKAHKYLHTTFTKREKY